jgi:hypothetical protein
MNGFWRLREDGFDAAHKPADVPYTRVTVEHRKERDIMAEPEYVMETIVITAHMPVGIKVESRCATAGCGHPLSTHEGWDCLATSDCTCTEYDPSEDRENAEMRLGEEVRAGEVVEICEWASPEDGETPVRYLGEDGILFKDPANATV